MVIDCFRLKWTYCEYGRNTSYFILKKKKQYPEKISGDY